MRKKTFIRILKKYNDGIATQAERRFIEAYYKLLGNEAGADSVFDPKDSADIRQSILDKVWETAGRQQLIPRLPAARRRMRSYRIAAAIGVLLGAGILFYAMGRRSAHFGHDVQSSLAGTVQQKIVPGGNKAMLTLSNGQHIVLDSTRTGLVATQGNIQISQLDSGLVYGRKARGSYQDGHVAYNTITTPRGGQYRVTLSDGSRIWLNSASSVRFPSSFTGSTREIQMKGEAYFEIASDASRPFIVNVDAVKIKVLGTHFDVNDYPEDSSIGTTLVSGAVQVTHGDTRITLKPGQQALLDKRSGDMRTKHVNVDQMLAWKNGLFYFDKTNITAIMEQVSRWYDVDVVYATTRLDNKNFSGVVSRYASVSELLSRMELTRTIHFKVEGRTITVMN
jgi:ferric-dicitrate binding protein FerR (iron transport regulator)